MLRQHKNVKEIRLRVLSFHSMAANMCVCKYARVKYAAPSEKLLLSIFVRCEAVEKSLRLT